MIKYILFLLFFALPHSWVEGGEQPLPSTQISQKGQTLVGSMGNEAISSLTGQLPEKERHERFRALLQKYFHLESIAKFVMGKVWKTMSAAQQERLLKILDHHVASLYANRFSKYSDQNQFTVLSGNVDEQGKVKVKSQLTQPGGPPVLIEWVIYEKGGELRVYDVLVEGVSMATTQRADYKGALERVGYNVDQFLLDLEKKIQQFL